MNEFPIARPVRPEMSFRRTGCAIAVGALIVITSIAVGLLLAIVVLVKLIVACDVDIFGGYDPAADACMDRWGWLPLATLASCAALGALCAGLTWSGRSR